jgi:hypothetical protein
VPEALAFNTAISFTTNTNGQNYGGETTLSYFSQMAGALDAGADDYMVKPFGVEELLARVRRALRHRLQQQGLGPVFRLHGLSLDFMAHRVTVGGAEVKLSRREFEPLRLLAEHAGKVMTHRRSSLPCGARRIATTSSICASMCASCAASSATTRPARASSRPSRGTG